MKSFKEGRLWNQMLLQAHDWPLVGTRTTVGPIMSLEKDSFLYFCSLPFSGWQDAKQSWYLDNTYYIFHFYEFLKILALPNLLQTQNLVHAKDSLYFNRIDFHWNTYARSYSNLDSFQLSIL